MTIVYFADFVNLFIYLAFIYLLIKMNFNCVLFTMSLSILFVADVFSQHSSQRKSYELLRHDEFQDTNLKFPDITFTNMKFKLDCNVFSATTRV